MGDLVFGTNPAQRFSIKVSMTGLCSYLACLMLILYCRQVGLIAPELVVPTSVALILTMVGFYAALRSGWSMRFADPSLTLPQMLTSITWDAIGYAATHEAHGGMLMLVIVTTTFGVFSLRGTSVRILQVYSLVLVGATMACMSTLNPQVYDPKVELVGFGSLAVSVLMLSWLVRQLADLRQREREQRNELTATLARIEEYATHDALTGLHNRRHMNTLLAHHLARAERGGEALSVALLDLDFFKRVNDTHGHAVGDEVLKTFARTAQAVLGDSEVLARWGGEEFLLLSTELDAPALRAAVDRVREQFTQVQVSNQVPELRANFSAGVAAHKPHENLAALIDRADQALYAAKAAGRGISRIDPLPSSAEAMAGAYDAAGAAA